MIVLKKTQMREKRRYIRDVGEAHALYIPSHRQMISLFQHSHNAICEDCGELINYGMAVNVIYGEGPSERGYGLPVKLTDNHMLTFEIALWQTLAFVDMISQQKN